MKLFILLFLLAGVVTAESTVEEIQRAITAQGASWQAGESWITQLTEDEFARLCGTDLTPPAGAAERFVSLQSDGDLPAHFDWRDNDGNWVTSVKNQKTCGSCWDFSATAQAEAWWQIVHADPDTNIDLSEQFVLSCSDAGSCDGGGVGAALSFFQENGVPLESCLPYQSWDGVPCSDACVDWQQQAVTIPGWGYVTLDEPIVENIKLAVLQHPLSVSYTVYKDFRFYQGGVYEHVWGEAEGGHAVLIVGWDDDDQSWIVKNSWGPNWGEDGYFRIKWGDSGMGAYSPFIYDSVTSQALSLSKKEAALQLVSGDSLMTEFYVKNSGQTPVQLSLIDYEVPILFHPSSFSSFDGSSWWCGDPEVGGYLNHWLQYLDSPLIDLTTAVNPVLSFKSQWVIEDPAGATDPWDGWDGANVWVSTDSGRTFSVIQPDEPAYTCNSLWSFGDSEQGWDMGPGIAGWAGNSDGWINASFDLSAFAGENIIVRFAFASDMGFCTADDSSVTGFFVDEILVADGEHVLFSNSGEDVKSMNRTGFGSVAAEWLSVEALASKVFPGDSLRVPVHISAASLQAGEYEGLVKVTSSDSLAQLDFRVHLEVEAPAFDVAVGKVTVPDSVPLLFPFAPRTAVQNKGLEGMSNVLAGCSILLNDEIIYADSLLIPLLPTGEEQFVTFRRTAIADTGAVVVEFFVEPSGPDAIAVNNVAERRVPVTSLIDDFEQDTQRWIMKDGWGITDKYRGHRSQFAAHVNGGRVPYEKRMNTIMTLAEPLFIEHVDSLVVSQWSWVYTQEDVDVCLFEISLDSLNWIVADSMSGNSPSFNMRVIDLTPWLYAGENNLWLRYRFVSDDENELVGVFIDDIRLQTHKGDRIPSTVVSEESAPATWALWQNYPNPFNPSTIIAYRLMKPARVSVKIYNLSGQLVETLTDETKPAGTYQVEWQAADCASGLYFYKLTAETEYGQRFQALKKMLLVR